MSAIDEQLLETLAASLGPAPDVEPTWAEVAALHRVIDSAADRQRRPAVGPIWRFRRRATAIAAAGAVLVGASAAAAATGGALPRPLRMAARAVGLPVESPNLASARSALARLRGSLGARPRDLGDVREQAQDVRDRLAHLSADDRAHVEAEATFLLAEADAVLAPPPAPLGGTPPIAPPAAGAPTPASPKASPADDHGSRAAPAADGHGSGGPGPGSDGGQSGDDHSGAVQPSGGSGSSGPGPSGDGDHTATTLRTDNSGPGSVGSDGGGSSHDGGSTDGEHSGPG